MLERLTRILFVVCFAALAGCHGAPSGTACNGHDELCARPYDQVVFPGTHDAYSNLAENFGAPDQSFPMARQLQDGVRVLHLEIYDDAGVPSLCHSVCAIGSKPLASGFKEIRAFVAAHPREVVTLLMESSQISSDRIAQAMKASGLQAFVHSQALGAPWPTLGELVKKGDRVVVFLADMTATGGPSYPWLLDRWKWTWETPWNNQTAADFSRCDADRGTMGNDLYVVDTYLEDLLIPTAAQAAWVNTNPFLADRLAHCQAVVGRLPNFVMVNYYEVGDLLHDVDILNGLAPPTGDDLDAFPPAFGDGGAGD